MKYLLALVFLIVIAFTTQVKADLPVHCLWNQTVGTWTFNLGNPEFSKDAGLKACDLNAKVNATSTKTFTLGYPNTVTDQTGANVGTFTITWDQGFEIIASGVRYYAFFLFSKNGNDVTSHCGKTFTGYYYKDQGPNTPNGYGCMNAVKVNQKDMDTTYPAHLFDTNFVGEKMNDAELIKSINEDPKSTWTATAYPQWNGLTMADLQRLGKGGRRIRSWRQKSIERGMAAFKVQAAKYAAKAAAKKVNEQIDWRNIDGQNFVSPVRNQASCGSCYIFGSVGQAVCRNRIKTNNADQTVYSTQDVLQCGNPIYAQGCEGGMQYQMGKYGYELGFIPESCKTYTAKEGECPAYDNRWGCSAKPLYLKDYKYTGGYYGATNEQTILESLQDGPVTAAFNVLRDFTHYRGGIYIHKKSALEIAAENDPNIPFVYVNHSVLIVGSGVSDEGVKYWIVRNSWGNVWGEKGYFRIERGVDMVAIESCAMDFILA